MGFSFKEETERRQKLESCKTVEEVESLRCNECASNGHWGWCDAPHINCAFKAKIKKILGENGHRYKQMAI